MAPLDTPASQQWQELMQQWQRVGESWAGWWMNLAPLPEASRQSEEAAPMPAMTAGAFAELNDRYAPRFQALATAALELPASGGVLPSLVEPAPGDRRFNAPAWREQPYFAFLKQAYLLYADYVRELAKLAPLPATEKRRLEFATRQYLDAVAPSNYPATNPEVLAAAIATEGASLVAGLRNLADDTQKGRITMTDERAFAVGRNLAMTPGSVVYRNELIELIQYDATTPTVYRRPLVIIPPCINKYYILDLKPENSFVRHAIAQGQTVFLSSHQIVEVERVADIVAILCRGKAVADRAAG